MTTKTKYNTVHIRQDNHDETVCGISPHPPTPEGKRGERVYLCEDCRQGSLHGTHTPTPDNIT